MEKSEMHLLKFTGKNYSPWSFQFELYLKGKKVGDTSVGSSPNPQMKIKLNNGKLMRPR